MVLKSGCDPASTNPQTNNLNNTWFDGFNVGIFRTPTNLEGKMIRWIHNINENLCFWGACYTNSNKKPLMVPTPRFWRLQASSKAESWVGWEGRELGNSMSLVVQQKPDESRLAWRGGRALSSSLRYGIVGNDCIGNYREQESGEFGNIFKLCVGVGCFESQHRCRWIASVYNNSWWKDFSEEAGSGSR